jgi:hypothetical protein
MAGVAAQPPDCRLAEPSEPAMPTAATHVPPPLSGLLGRCGRRPVLPACSWAKRSGAPALLLASDAPADIDPGGYLVSEKFDGVRAFWDGRRLCAARRCAGGCAGLVQRGSADRWRWTANSGWAGAASTPFRASVRSRSRGRSDLARRALPGLRTARGAGDLRRAGAALARAFWLQAGRPLGGHRAEHAARSQLRCAPAWRKSWTPAVKD